MQVICQFPQEGPTLEALLLALLRQGGEEEAPWGGSE